MREAVLLVNFKDAKRLREIQMILMANRVLMKPVKKEEYCQTIGALAGVEGEVKTDEVYDGEDLEQEMMIFAGLGNSKLDQILHMMRKKGMKRVDYKAVLTPTNARWKVADLYNELAKEHKQMHNL